METKAASITRDRSINNPGIGVGETGEEEKKSGRLG